VRLDAALRTAHRSGGFGDIEFFPVTQQESFPLTRRQAADFLFDREQDLRPRDRIRRALRCQRAAEDLQGLENVEVAFPVDVSKSEKFFTTALRTFCRRNQSIVALERMRWNSSGSSAAGRSR
jgi:hypothetical protein